MGEPQGRAATTAAAIERAALDLVQKHGYEGATVAMICTHVGVSQRTFFNHFPTKDDALLGREHPQIDERAARRFIVSEGPLLLDALSLIQFPTSDAHPSRFRDRMRVIATVPSLMSRQIERIAEIEAELREIIGVRLERDHPERSETEREDQASLVTHLLAGVIRFAGSLAAEGLSSDALTDRARATLQLVLADSAR